MSKGGRGSSCPWFLVLAVAFVLAGSFCGPGIANARAVVPPNEFNPWCLFDFEQENGNGIVYSRCIQNGTIALTYDDGPNPGANRTQKVLDVLQDLNVTAAFFVNGANYANIDNESVKSLLERILDDGHSIGSHAWNHWNLTDQDNASIAYQLEHLTDKLEEIVSIRPTIMRPPYGNYNQRVIEIVNGQLGYKFIMWGIDSCDWDAPGNVESGIRYYNRILHGKNPATTPGFIVLHHDPIAGSDTLAAGMIEHVTSLGYRLVSLEECLGFPL